MFKKWLAVILSAAILLSAAPCVQATEGTDPSASPTPSATPIPDYSVPALDPSKVSCEAAILIDADTGEVLYAKNADQKMYPASTMKVLTAVVAAKYGDLDATFTFTDAARAMVESDASQLYIDTGETMTVRDMIYGLLLVSAADCAVGLALAVGGDMETFVNMMNEEAAALGMASTHVTNPTGMPNENLYTTAEDMAKLMQAVHNDDLVSSVVGTYHYEISADQGGNDCDGYSIYNSNRLISLDENEPYAYSYCTGGKTGYTSAAGHTLVEMASRDNGEGNIQNLICVVLKDSKEGKWTSAINMLNYGFTNYSTINLTEMLQEKTVTVTVENASPDDLHQGQLELGMPMDATAKVVTLTQPRVQVIMNNQDNIHVDYTLTAEPLVAPIAEGEPVGTVTFSLSGEELLSSQLVARREVRATKMLLVGDDKAETEPDPLERPLLWWIWLIPIAVAAPIVLLLALYTRRRANRFRSRRSSKYHTYRRRI